MFNKHQYLQERIDRILNEKVQPVLYSSVNELTDLKINYWVVDLDSIGEPVAPAVALGLNGNKMPEYTPYIIGKEVIQPWQTAWFKVSGTIPKNCTNAELVIGNAGLSGPGTNVGLETIAFNPDGTIIKSTNSRNPYVPLKNNIPNTERFEIFLEVAGNPEIFWTPHEECAKYGVKPSVQSRKNGIHSTRGYGLTSVQVMELNESVYNLNIALEVCKGLLNNLDKNKTHYWRVVKAVEQALNVFDVYKWQETAPKANEALSPVFNSKNDYEGHILTASSHSHLDTGWLWPFRESKRKIARTVANVLHLMENRKELTFSFPAIQHIVWIEENYPDLFKRLTKRIQEKRVEIVGDNWVEFDSVLPTGESFIRQITYAKRYVQKKFGSQYLSDIAWLPDSFGYSGSLPQIFVQGGFKYFQTQKMSWNDTNPFPHHTFFWESPDGSKLLTHFPPSNCYGANGNVDEVVFSENNYKEKEISSHGLLLYGFSDGGGGPARHVHDAYVLMKSIQNIPKISFGTSSEFFQKLTNELEPAINENQVAHYRGEMYFEFHRGVSTSQNFIKNSNRKIENMLRLTEYLLSICQLKKVNIAYSQEKIDEVWKSVMLFQFHDVITGASINWVYQDAKEAYTNNFIILEKIIEDCLTALQIAPAMENYNAQIEVNPLDSAGGVDLNLNSETGYYKRVISEKIGKLQEDFSIKVEDILDNSNRVISKTQDDCFILQNDNIKVCVHKKTGFVYSVVDNNSREFVSGNIGELTISKDFPHEYDAWDVQRQSLISPRKIDNLISTELIGSNVIKSRYKYGKDNFFDIIYWITNENKLFIDYNIENWNQKESWLRAIFPTTIKTTKAYYDSQYNTVENSTIDNTSIDEAQFERCTHRFIAFTEQNTGVVLHNRSTYGGVAKWDNSNSTTGVTATASLLRQTRFPDNNADIGNHKMNFALSFENNIQQSFLKKAILDSYNFNATEFATYVGQKNCINPPFRIKSCNGGACQIDWVKLANDGSGDLILRIYEPVGSEFIGKLELTDELVGHSGVFVDLLEAEKESNNSHQNPDFVSNEQIELLVKEGKINLKPHQLRSLRIKL